MRDEIRDFVQGLPKSLNRPPTDVGNDKAAKSRVLFLCAHNSCRSQMAEAFLRRYAPERFEAFSAGVDAQPIHPLVAEVMKERGIDISRQRAKSVREYMGKAHFQYLIVVCKETQRDCPRIFPDTGNRLFWPFEDPASFAGTDNEKLEKFRQVRDQIEARIKAWIGERT